ncbi:MAG: Hpt domain-containing protein [Chloroflexi bacterium]|nr:Hpt domain-containing protein [Chloroflexota bacterium]
MSKPMSIDLSMFDKLKQDMGEDYICELIDAYLADTSRTLEKIRQAVAEGKIDEMRRAAHSIKSTSANFGAVQFSSLAKDLEALGKSNTLKGASEILRSMETQYFQVARDLRKMRGA